MRRLPTIHSLVLALVGVCALSGCKGSVPEGRARRVIVISCDTLRPDRLGCYGHARPTSPNVDAFARDAVLYEDAWSTAPWTGPAMSALFTGRLPDEIGVPGGNRFPLPPAAITVAELARDAGYETGAVVSNWVLRRPPAELGDAGVAQGFEQFDDAMTAREKNRENLERVAPDTTDAALAWLAEREKAGEDRFLLWVHYQDPHGPYTPPEADLARVRGADPLPTRNLPAGKTLKGKGQIPSYQLLGEERRAGAYAARYEGEIAYFDTHFGRLLDALRAKDWYGDALIVFTADHGESLGEHDYWFCHGENVHRDEVQVPLVVRFPDTAGRKAGERVRAPAGHLDLWPTMLEALGIAGEANRGLSLFGALPDTRLQVSTLGLPRSPVRWVGFGDGRWRMLIEGASAPRLFDAVADPDELRDLAREQPEVVADLVRRHAEYLASGTGVALDPRAIGPSAEVDRALHRLGYTDGDEH